jgi:hypothetical protein
MWLTVSAAAILLGVLEARLNWSGIPIQLGDATVGLTVYPPLFLALLLAIWLGPMWGIIPGYAAGLISGLIGGLTIPQSLIFACATPVEVLIVWGTMVLLQIHPDLPRNRDLALFAGIGLVAAAASSLGGLIWIEVRRLDVLSGERIWQGWLVGDFLEMAVLAPIVLRLFGPRVRAWVDEQVPAPPRLTVSYTRATTLVAAIIALLAIMVARGVALMLHSLSDNPLWASPRGAGHHDAAARGARLHGTAPAHCRRPRHVLRDGPGPARGARPLPRPARCPHRLPESTRLRGALPPRRRPQSQAHPPGVTALLRYRPVQAAQRPLRARSGR